MKAVRSIALLVALVGLPTPAAADGCALIAKRAAIDGPGGFGFILPKIAERAPRLLRFATVTAYEKDWPARVNASAELAAAVEDWGTSAYIPDVLALSADSLGAVSLVAGTLRCSDFVFFERTRAGARLVPLPPHYRKGAPNLCWTDQAWLAELGGEAATIEEEYDAASGRHVFYVTPWRNHRWGPTCQLKLKFRRDLRMGESWCRQGVPCASVRTAALELARREERGVKNEPPAAALMVAVRADEDRVSEIPGRNDREPFAYGRLPERKYLGFPGQRIAVFGKGYLGWREYPGHVMGVWELAKDELTPVGGFAVEWVRGPLLTVEQTPKPKR